MESGIEMGIMREMKIERMWMCIVDCKVDPDGDGKGDRDCEGDENSDGDGYVDCEGYEDGDCAADFSLLNLPKGKSLGRSKPTSNS